MNARQLADLAERLRRAGHGWATLAARLRAEGDEEASRAAMKTAQGLFQARRGAERCALMAARGRSFLSLGLDPTTVGSPPVPTAAALSGP